MTWRTQNGERTLKCAEASLITAILGYTADMIAEELEGLADPWSFGVTQFDRLEAPSRFALLAEVGWALLRETKDCPPLTAINEATIAALFSQIEQCIEFEIDCQDDMDDAFYWRTRVLAAYREGGDLEDLPEPDCTDTNEWDILIACLAERILWDEDYKSADMFLDAPPETAGFMRHMMTIDEDYYRAIPPDPRDSELPGIRAVLVELCRQ